MKLHDGPAHRVVSLLRVQDEKLWRELGAVVDIDGTTRKTGDPLVREAMPAFEREGLHVLSRQGLGVLIRYARRSAEEVEAAHAEVVSVVEGLPRPARVLLHRAQRHAREGVVLGSRVWDPTFDGRHVQALLGAGLIEALPSEQEHPWGPYRLHPDLPPPPAPSYDFAEAAMAETDDLSAPRESLIALLHDLATFTAAASLHPPRRTHAGTLDKVTTRKLGRRLADDEVASSGTLVHRWLRALHGLEALGALSMEPIARTITVEPGLEETLAGTTAEAIDRLVHRLVDPDLQAAIPAVRAALAQACGPDDGAVDEMIFRELLAEQHRDVLHAPWHRDGLDVYPMSEHDTVGIPFDEEHFELVEGPMLSALLRILDRLGLVRRADGVFAPTVDGRVWALGEPEQRPPVWISSDMGVTVPPHAITPWERYQLERLGRCTTRDVVDTYTLERDGLAAWLATHDIDDAEALLRRRCPAVPPTVLSTLRAWADSALRITLTRGVLLATS